MKKAIIYLIEFLAIQLIGGFAVDQLWKLFGGDNADSALRLITTASVTSVLTIVLFLTTRAAEVSPRWLRTRPWAVLCWSVIAALGTILPSSWLVEQMPELPNIVEQEFDMILQNRWGYLAVGLLAPLSEELVLRGAVLRSLLGSSRLSPWAAIALSAVFFALVHFNPAQMPHAFIIGLLLGWMYWVNNTVAYVMYNIYPDPDMELIDLFGNQRTELAAVFFSLLILLPAIYQLHLRQRHADEA